MQFLLKRTADVLEEVTLSRYRSGVMGQSEEQGLEELGSEEPVLQTEEVGRLILIVYYCSRLPFSATLADS